MRRYIKRFREFLIETKWKLFFWLYMKSVWLFVKLDTIRFQSIELKDVFSPEVLELNRRMAKSIYTKSGMCASKRVNTYGELKTPKDTDITAPPIHPDCVDVPFSSVTEIGRAHV